MNAANTSLSGMSCEPIASEPSTHNPSRTVQPASPAVRARGDGSATVAGLFVVVVAGSPDFRTQR